MLSGDNGILQKATEAKTRTERQSIIEQARTDILGKFAENKGENISKQQLKDILNTYFDENEVETLEIPDDTSTSNDELTAKEGNYRIRLSEIYSGTFSTSEETILAKDVLTINESASTDAKSPYVNYPSSKGTILCRVLYDSSSENGLQIVSVNTTENFGPGINDSEAQTHGSNDFEKAKWSYNNVIETLNKHAKAYIDNEEIATSARCIGSDPKEPNKEDGGFFASTQYEYLTTYNVNDGTFRNTDNHYTEDENQLKALGAYAGGSSFYWLASRFVDLEFDSNEARFSVRFVIPMGDGSTVTNLVCSVNSSGTKRGFDSSWRYKTCIQLKP